MDQIIQDLLCNVKKYLTDLTDNERFFALKEHMHSKQNITDFEHGNESHSETYITEQDSKNYTDNGIGNAKTELQTKIDNKSKVTFSRSLNSGNNTTQIGTITIDGVSTDIYCEKDTDTTYTAATTKPKADAEVANKGTSTQYARADHVHPTKKSEVSFKPNSKLTSDKVQIGEITINGTTTEMFCQNTVYTHPTEHSATIIKDSAAHSNIGSQKNADQADINNRIDGKLATKVDKEENKGLSTNDFNDTYKSQLDGLTSTLATKVDKEENKGLSTNDFNDTYKGKIDSVYDTSYSIYLNDKFIGGNPSQERPDPGLTLEVDKSTHIDNIHGNYGQIYACVKKNKGRIIDEGTIVFIINGVTYVRHINKDNYAATINIRLNNKDLNGDYIKYTVIAMFVQNGWTEAIDIKSMLVFNNTAEKQTYNNADKDIVHN